jgi:hypothetical protein
MSFGAIGRELKETVYSLAPAVALIVLFQVAFIRMPLAEFLPILLGLLFTVAGFVLFVQGAKVGLLPLGEGIGSTFIERRALGALLVFGFLLGIVLTVAEPDVRLLAYQMEASLQTPTSRTELIGVAAIGLGVFGLIALLRIAFGTPIHLILIPGYLICTVLVAFAPEVASTQAYDMGAVTTGPMTVPFLLALGVGMASVLGGRDRMQTGFGLMAIGSIGPVMAILVWNLVRGGA